MSGIERILKLKEEKKPILSLEHLPYLFEVITNFLKANNKSHFLSNEELLIMIEIKESKYPYFLKISDEFMDFGSGKIESANIIIIIDLKTISDLIFGRLEAIIAIFSEKIKFIGDLYKLLSYLEIFYSSLDYSNILKKEERSIPIKIKEMKELLEVYYIGSSIGEPYHISSFLTLLSLFANHCHHGQEQISGKDVIICLNITDVGDYTIKIFNNKLTWEHGTPKKLTLKIVSNLSDFIDVIINGDTVTSYMAGNLKLEGENAIPDSMFFQELTEKYLDFFGLGKF